MTVLEIKIKNIAENKVYKLTILLSLIFVCRYWGVIFEIPNKPDNSFPYIAPRENPSPPEYFLA